MLAIDKLLQEKEFLLLSECADILRCSERTIRRLINDRKLEACKVRGGLRVVAKSFKKFKREIIDDFQFEHGAADYPGEDPEDSVTDRDKS